MVAAQTADSTETNRRLAKDMGHAHFPCMNHTFAMDVGELDKAETDLSKHCKKVREALSNVKQSIKETNILKRFTPLAPKTVKTCKWTEKAHSVKRMEDGEPFLSPT